MPGLPPTMFHWAGREGIGLVGKQKLKTITEEESGWLHPKVETVDEHFHGNPGGVESWRQSMTALREQADPS